MSLPTADLRVRHLATSRESTLRHILASPGYAPGIIAVNVTWIEREFNAGQMARSIHPSTISEI